MPTPRGEALVRTRGYCRNRNYYAYGLYLLALWEFYSCHITTEG